MNTKLEIEPKKHKLTKRHIQIIAGVLVLAVLISVFVWRYSTQWERDFTIKYIGYDTNSNEYKYEITNNTNKAFIDVEIYIGVVSGVYGRDKLTFRDRIYGTIQEHQTVTYTFTRQELLDGAEERGVNLIFEKVRIKRLAYRKLSF